MFVRELVEARKRRLAISEMDVRLLPHPWKDTTQAILVGWNDSYCKSLLSRICLYSKIPPEKTILMNTGANVRSPYRRCT